MTDTEKLVVVSLISAIRADNEARMAIECTLGELEAARAVAAEQRAMASKALHAAIGRAEDLINGS